MSFTTSLRSAGTVALGRRRDWSIPRPRLRLTPLRAWIGPLLVAVTTVVGWFAFTGARGEEGGSVALGLFVGAASIVLMAWSFILAVRIRPLEKIFGGLDRMYQAHRWAGALSVPLMFWHVRVEPEIEGGIRGAARSVAESAEGLAGVGEYLLYVLVGLSFLRWFPYRVWRWTHKLLGVPFVFACWHFFTAEKPYANGSAWGWFFGTIMAAGIGSYVWRVGWRDMVARGTAYKVVRTQRVASTIEVELAPVRTPIRHHAGQFAVLKFQARGLAEPHPFTIASSPDSENLRFFIRDLGDWSSKIVDGDLVGTRVLVEGPYGEFEPVDHRSSVGPVWVAGGVGITPFLSALGAAPVAPAEQRPTLFYCVRSRADATALHELEAAADAGRLNLHVLDSEHGNRFSPERFTELLGGRSLAGVHVAACGPSSLLGSVTDAARALGACGVETEAFDIRSGVGPDLSKPIDDALRARRSVEAAVPAVS